MNNFISLIICSVLIFSSCKKEEISSATTLKSSSITTNNSDDFSDLEKKDDESCDSEKDLEKEIMKKAKEGKGMSLQGDPGCSLE